MVDIIPKQSDESFSRSGAALFFAFLLLSVLIGGFFWLRYENKKLADRVANLDALIAKPLSAGEAAAERDRVAYRRKLSDFAALSDEAGDPLGVFRLLEETTLPSVTFTHAVFGAEEKKISLTGTANDFQSVERQVRILREDPRVDALNVLTIGLGEKGGVAFEIEVVVKNSLLKN